MGSSPKLTVALIKRVVIIEILKFSSNNNFFKKNLKELIELSHQFVNECHII